MMNRLGYQDCQRNGHGYDRISAQVSEQPRRRPCSCGLLTTKHERSGLAHLSANSGLGVNSNGQLMKYLENCRDYRGPDIESVAPNHGHFKPTSWMQVVVSYKNY